MAAVSSNHNASHDAQRARIRMVPGEIVCAHCGWRNEATARMCGGCGQPLRMSGAPADAALTQAVPIRSAPAQTNGLPLPSTAPAPTGVYPATHAASQMPYAASYVATAPAWPGPGQPSGGVAAQPAAQRSRWRIPIVLLVTLCVLLAATLGAWALVIRPAVHAAVDGQLQRALDTAIEQAAPASASIPPGTRLSITISAADVNADINSELGDVPVKNVQVHFHDGGYINTSYSLLGSGAIVTQLVPLANGRVEAVNTDVTGPLTLVESSDEMTRTFDEALGRLPAQYHVSQITVSNDTLKIGVSVGE